MRGNDYCSVVVDLGLTSVNCAENTKIAAKTKDAIDVAAALNGNKKVTRNIIAPFDIIPSKTAGYEIIRHYFLEVGDLNLYRKTGTTKWTVIDTTTPAKDGSTCTLFTGEAKLAFKGETCQDKNGKDQTI
jgi:hypothetical protein